MTLLLEYSQLLGSDRAMTEGPDVEGPHVEGPDVEGPDVEGEGGIYQSRGEGYFTLDWPETYQFATIEGRGVTFRVVEATNDVQVQGRAPSESFRMESSEATIGYREGPDVEGPEVEGRNVEGDDIEGPDVPIVGWY